MPDSRAPEDHAPPGEATSGTVTAGRPSRYLEFATPPPEPVESKSQAVALFPVVKGRRVRDARFLGLPLPAWIMVGSVSVVAIIAALAILPRVGGPGSAQTAPSGGGGVGQVGGVTGTPEATGGASAAPSALPTPTGAGGPGPEGTPRLEVTNVSSVQQVVRMKISITITNPASVDQDWRNASVQISDGLGSLLQAITPGIRVYDAGRTVCVEPTGDATIAAGGSVLVEFTVNTLLSGQPDERDTQVDNPVCVGPPAG